MADDSPVSGGWLTDRIVEVSQESQFRRHLDGAAFRLDSTGPYLRLHFVNIYVSDQEQSLRFFVDKLGFTIVADVRFASGNRWVEVAPPDGTAVLALVLPMPAFNEEHLVGNSGLVTFLAEDVEGTYREWCARGVQFTLPPQTPTWGGTFCRFVDPDGNSFALAGFSDVTRSIDERRRAYAEKLESERRLAQELEIAREVQVRLFPQVMPEIPDLDYAGICVQARSVGGDYYDFLELGPGRLALVIGDIAGKGIAAALLMANLQANLRSQAFGAADDPQRFLSSVNRLLFENTTPGSYATLFFADYHAETGRILYANCGHVPGLILRAGGAVEQLNSNATVLGLFEKWNCDPCSTTLGSNDLLVFYTDGITESENDKGEEFGQERLIEAIRRHRSLSSTDLAKAISKEVLEFSHGRQFDDLTLIIAKRR